jgi:hypothetical protein
MSFLIEAYKSWSAEEAAQHFKVYFQHLEKVKPIEASGMLWEWKHLK